MNKRRNVSESTKKKVAGKQWFKCANRPNSKLKRIENHLCPLWAIDGENKGNFNDDGYHIDHIDELCVSGNNDITNLQALCKTCHSVKTRNFMQIHKRRRKNNNHVIEISVANVDSIDVKDMSKDNGDDKNDNNDIEDVDKDNNDIENVNNDIENVRADVDVRIFKCSTCDKEFKSQQNLNYHVEKNACKEYICNCKYCDKGFTTKSNMYTHIRSSCKAKKQKDEEKDEIYKKLLEIEEMKKKLIELEKTNKKLLENDNKKLLENDNKKLLENDNKKLVEQEKIEKTVVAKNMNICTIDSHNITLIGHGKEDLSKIDKNEILQAIKHEHNSIIKLTEVLHFNPKHPEYNNAYITNIKDKYAMMFNGNDWIITMKSDMIDKIYNDIKNYIKDNVNMFANSLSASEWETLYLWSMTEDDNERILKVKEEMKLLFYNKRNIILDKKTKRKR